MLDTSLRRARAADTTPTRERTGGPRAPRPQRERTSRYTPPTSFEPCGSHMPLDTQIHWSWSNPLLIIPGFILLMFVIALALILAQLF